jgi:dCMP deaminase
MKLNTEKVKTIIRQHKWDRHFLKMALLIASKSRDNSMGVGCVIVGPDNEIRSTGYNGFPRGVHYNESRQKRPDKYVWTEHGERNAVYNAARIGVSLKDCTAYVACTDLVKGGNAPCAECTRAFIQAGIKEIVEYATSPVEDDGTWRSTTRASLQMLNEAGVSIRYIDDE